MTDQMPSVVRADPYAPQRQQVENARRSAIERAANPAAVERVTITNMGSSYAANPAERTPIEAIALWIVQLSYGDMMQLSDEIMKIAADKPPTTKIEFADLLHIWADKTAPR